MQKVKEKLSSITSLSSTTDMWSSTVGLRPYMSDTIHFIDKYWNHQSISLGTHYLPAIVLGEVMESVLHDWDLKAEQQVSVTTDKHVSSCSPMSWTQVSCFGHNLHLGVTKEIYQDSRCSQALYVGLAQGSLVHIRTHHPISIWLP